MSERRARMGTPAKLPDRKRGDLRERFPPFRRDELLAEAEALLRKKRAERQRRSDLTAKRR